MNRSVTINFEEIRSLALFHLLDKDTRDEIINKYTGTITIEQAIDFGMIFFVRREAIEKMALLTVWEDIPPTSLFIVPLADLVVNNTDFMFFSHFWRTREHPDPEGCDLRYLQKLNSNETAKYIWIDFCCIPQRDMSSNEERYAKVMLSRIPKLLQLCCWDWHYVDDDSRNRAWIFFEIFLTLLLSVYKDPPLFSQHEKYKTLIDDFLQSKSSVQIFTEDKKFSTSSRGDLTYICNTLSVILKLRSIPQTPVIWTRQIISHMTNIILSSPPMDNPQGVVHLVGGPQADFGTGEVIISNQQVEIDHDMIRSIVTGSALPTHMVNSHVQISLLMKTICSLEDAILEPSEENIYRTSSTSSIVINESSSDEYDEDLYDENNEDLYDENNEEDYKDKMKSINSPAIDDLLQKVSSNVINYFIHRWDIHKGNHHRIYLNKSVIIAEIYHQIRSHLSNEQISVDAPLTELQNNEILRSADIYFYWRPRSKSVGGSAIQLQVEVLLRGNIPEPGAIDLILRRLACLNYFAYFVVVGSDELLTELINRTKKDGIQLHDDNLVNRTVLNDPINDDNSDDYWAVLTRRVSRFLLRGLRIEIFQIAGVTREGNLSWP